MKHPNYCKNFDGSLKDLAKNISNMRYAELEEFLKYLAENLYSDGCKDIDRNRLQLGTLLCQTANNLFIANKIMEKIWKICKKYEL